MFCSAGPVGGRPSLSTMSRVRVSTERSFIILRVSGIPPWYSAGSTSSMWLAYSMGLEPLPFGLSPRSTLCALVNCRGDRSLMAMHANRAAFSATSFAVASVLLVRW